MDNKNVKKNLLDHSRAKIILLEKYLEKYLNIISNDQYTEKIHVFDLFCGEGLYENNGEGSPIVILKVLKELYYSNFYRNRKTPKIDVLLNDKDDLKIEKLNEIISERKLHEEKCGKLIFRSKDYKEIIGNLIKYVNNLKNEKAFIFIDPYGYKEIRASEIKSLLKSKKSEVLLFLPTQFMYRFDEKGTPQALIEILEELVDLKEWKPNTSVFAFIEQFKDTLKSYLGDEFFVDTFTIQKDVSTVYCLFFFSSHIRGFEKMLESKWQIDEEEGKGWKYEKTGSLFSTIRTNALEEKLIEYLSKNKKIHNGDIYQFILRQGFLPKHATETFTELQEKGKLEVLPLGSRKGAFYISYDNYKNNYKKVCFKLK